MTETDPHELYGDPNPESVEMLAARREALHLLSAVTLRKEALDHALDHSKGFKTLPSRDRAFCRMLIATTLRRLGQIDDIIARSEDRPGSSAQNRDLQNILRLGTAQILFMNVPDHAAVDTSVRLADAAGMEHQKGFTNALLRNITRNGQALVAKQDAARLNTPEWLLKTWIEDYELKGAAEIALANLSEAPLDITVKEKASMNYWGGVLQASSFPTGSLRISTGGHAAEMPGFDDGMWWVQDAAAAIPAKLFGNIEGQHVIDMCAAPGGKTAQLAAMGAHVTALDRSAQRLRRLKENLKRLRLEDAVEVQATDATVWQPRSAPHYILLDAPCTATGTVRRHPDILHLKTARDMERLITVQANLLQHAFDILAPGGILIYCTCSLQKVEGEYQIARFIDANPGAIKLAISSEEVGDMEEIINDHGDLRILPSHRATGGGMDGFFISRLTKS